MSCGVYDGPLLNPQVLKRMSACPAPHHSDFSSQSFDSMLSVLVKNQWAIVYRNYETKIIDARKCKQQLHGHKEPLKMPQERCLDLHFEIGPTGAIGYKNPPEKRFHWKIQHKVKGWVDEMERDFSAVRCFSTAELRAWRESPR